MAIGKPVLGLGSVTSKLFVDLLPEFFPALLEGFLIGLKNIAALKIQLDAAQLLGEAEPLLDISFASTVEHGGREVDAQRPTGPAQVGLKNLPDIHAGRHAQGVQHDVHGGAIRQVRHVLNWEDAAHHALVAVAASHLVTHLQLALHGDVALHGLQDAGHQFVALFEAFHALIQDVAQYLQLAFRLVQDIEHLGLQPLLARGHGDLAEALVGHGLEHVLGELLALGQQLLALIVGQKFGEFLVLEEGHDLLFGLGADDPLFVLKILVPLQGLLVFNLLGAEILLLALAGEDLHVHHGALDTGAHGEAGVLHIAGFFAEDGAEQLLFGAQDGLALGRDLAHQNVTVLDRGADADDAAFVEVLEHLLADLGNVAGDFLRAQFGVAGVDLEFLDMDGGVEIFLHHALRDEDGVLEVIAPPGHVGHDEVSAQCQFAALGARAVRQDLVGGDVLALFHEGHLVEAGVLVGAGVLDERVDVHAALFALGV